MKKTLIIGGIAIVAILSSCQKKQDCSELLPPPPKKECRISHNNTESMEIKEHMAKPPRKPRPPRDMDCKDLPTPNIEENILEDN